MQNAEVGIQNSEVCCDFHPVCILHFEFCIQVAGFFSNLPGPDDRRATTLVVGLLRHARQLDVNPMRGRSTDGGDVTRDLVIAAPLADWLRNQSRTDSEANNCPNQVRRDRRVLMALTWFAGGSRFDGEASCRRRLGCAVGRLRGSACPDLDDVAVARGLGCP